VDSNLQRHPYTSTSIVTLHIHLHPMKSSALSTVSTRHISYFYRDFTKAPHSKIFWILSRCPRGSTPQFSDSPPCATYPRIFSRLSTPFYAPAKLRNLTSNVTPTLRWSGVYRGDQPVARTPYKDTFYRGFTKALPFKKIFGPFSAAPGAQHNRFRIPLHALRTFGFFPASPHQLTTF